MSGPKKKVPDTFDGTVDPMVPSRLGGSGLASHLCALIPLRLERFERVVAKLPPAREVVPKFLEERVHLLVMPGIVGERRALSPGDVVLGTMFQVLIVDRRNIRPDLGRGQVIGLPVAEEYTTRGSSQPASTAAFDGRSYLWLSTNPRSTTAATRINPRIDAGRIGMAPS